MKKIFTLFAALAMVMSMSAAPYLRGSFNDWGGGNPLSSGSTTITLGAKATYTFKVEDNGTWYGNDGTMTSTNCTDWTMSSSKGDCKITTTIAGVYTFKWNNSSKKLSVVYPTEAVVIDYYIAGSKGLCGDEWKVDGIKMVNNDGVYTHTFTKVPAGTYEFKVTQGDWNKTSYGYGALATSYKNVADKDGNIQVTFAETQDLTVTFQGSTISLNLPEKTNTVYFVNEKNWTNVHAYVWDTNPYKEWPGEEMTKVEGKTFNGKDVYTYTFPAKNTNIIFSQNGANDKKTDDLKYNESKIYYYNSTWNATIEYDKPKYNVDVTAENGTVTGAGEYEEGAEATLTAAPAEGYEFTCWTSGEDTVSTANPYTFTVTADVALVANFVAVDYKDITFTVGKVGFTGVPQIKWWGAKGLEDAAEPVEMTAGQYNRYSYTFSNIDAITGVSFYIVLDGVQSKTITLHETPNTYSYFYNILQEVFVTLDGEIEGVQLEGHPMAGYSSDYTKVNGVVQLPANTTKAFKLTVDGKDKGGNTIALTKDNLTANFTEDGEGNATIATELAGGYLFTYDYITKDVTVVYPFVGTMDLGQMTPSYSDESVTLKDDNYNEVTIYNVVEGEHTYGENFDIEASVKHNGEWYTLTGKGSWTLADGVITLVTTNLVDENKTVNYTITATALAPQEYTIACNGTYDEEVTEYYSSIKYAATTDEEDVIVIEIGVYGEETSASGQFNDTWFTTLTYTVEEGEDGVKVLTATATDEAGNTYHITITATKLVYPSVNIYGATATLNEEEGALTLSGEYEGQTINCEILGYIGAGDYEYVGILAADYSFEWGADIATVTEDGDQYTITGVFMDYTTEEKYEVMITTAKNPATALENVTSTVAPVKAIVNGQLVIVKDGVQYNAQGAVVK